MGRRLWYIDHLTHNVYRGRLNEWAGFYERIFNFRRIRYFDIAGKFTGLHSRAMTGPDGKIRIPINEDAGGQGQIEEYLQQYKGEARRLRHRGRATNARGCTAFGRRSRTLATSRRWTSGCGAPPPVLRPSCRFSRYAGAPSRFHPSRLRSSRASAPSPPPATRPRRPAWPHTFTSSPIYGQYDAKPQGFVPGGFSPHNQMLPHGPDPEAFEGASRAALEPEKLVGTMAFMFETRLPQRVTA